ncbi:unnamed protein product [Nezara viridula]|uniref:Uncharacterized protein n=1 Tax=Nezara viridula TaxID=85310 RepID=A0A9P0E3C4_NEZVI|nr:unnamed protein product [Nezara viridula]
MLQYFFKSNNGEEDSKGVVLIFFLQNSKQCLHFICILLKN